MKRVGAIWLIPATKVKRIHRDLDYDIIVAVSEDTDYWFAGPQDFFTFRIGEDFDFQAISISGPQDYPWNHLRDALLAGTLGAPDEVWGPIYEDLKRKLQRVSFRKNKKTCDCSFQRLGAMGCPSMRGEECPTLAGIVSKDDIYR